MSEISTIEWTDATWNPVRGCTKISPGCKHCYAEVFAERFRGDELNSWPKSYQVVVRCRTSDDSQLLSYAYETHEILIK